MFRNLWKDDAGVVALEYLFLCVIVGLGMAVGYSAISDSLNAEYVELGQAIICLDDGYYTNDQGAFGIQSPLALGRKNGTHVEDNNGTLNYAHSVTSVASPVPALVNATP